MGVRAAILACGLAVGALAVDRPWLSLAAAVSAVAAPVVFLHYEARPKIAPHQRRALLALVVAAASTLPLRLRDADQLAENPLDWAAMVRVGCLVIAGLLALSVILVTMRHPIPVPLKAYAAYAAVVVLAVPVATAPSLVLFRFVDLATFWLVALACWVAFGHSTTPLIRMYWIMGILLLVVVAAAVAWPDLVLTPSDGVLPFRFGAHLRNELGAFGILFFALGLARATWMCWAGLAVIVATQYRTGYVAVAAILCVYFVLRRGTLHRAALVGLVALGPLLMSTSEFQRAWYRGESEDQVESLNGRTEWWRAGVDVAERSPVVGTGLTSGTRFEVLDELGYGNMPTIHNTWVEAYVGTGLLGLVALGFASVVAFRLAVRTARSHQDLLPALIFTGLAVRSLTGSTIEVTTIFMLVFLTAIQAGVVLTKKDAVREEWQAGMNAQRDFEGAPVSATGP